MTTSDVYRILVLTSSLVVTGIMFAVALKYRERWLYTVPPAAILLNWTAFSIVRLIFGHTLSPEMVQFFNGWANIVALQTIFTIALIGVYYLCQKR